MIRDSHLSNLCMFSYLKYDYTITDLAGIFVIFGWMDDLSKPSEPPGLFLNNVALTKT